MTSSHKSIFSGIVLVGSFSLASLACAAGPNVATAYADFMKMDTNKDNKVSAGEHAAASKVMFDMMDANKDDKVTASEMDAVHQRVTGKKAGKADMSAADKIKVIDTDSDGILTAAEHATGSSSMLQKMDTNQDGFLTKKELAGGHASMLKKPSR